MTPDETRTALANNVRVYRLTRRLKQADIADQMQARGHSTWHQVTVSEVESNQRNLSATELATLSTVLNVGIYRLLEPADPS